MASTSAARPKTTMAVVIVRIRERRRQQLGPLGVAAEFPAACSGGTTRHFPAHLGQRPPSRLQEGAAKVDDMRRPRRRRWRQCGSGPLTIRLLSTPFTCEVKDAATDIKNMRAEMQELIRQNMELKAENKKLSQKCDELEQYQRLNNLEIKDSAAYKHKAARLLKTSYPQMAHVTCLGHALNRVCEEPKKHFRYVGELNASAMAVFQKTLSRVRSFKEGLWDVPLPPEPILTRWGTWLEVA
ncbi:hypothetical protein HPB49_021513 [Dermacentor silvarum]|uniref:Uncharacterized protein n=1 Tax=Dermacentor silvarum TaxID=543639 RepID=A0ACB8D082_DERSI|nr:hypothetical protein HPB49_021513 [Dermacentor silvarum]